MGARWTVGPHAPAVYWRRRGAVLVGIALLAALVWFAVHGAGASRRPGAGGSSPTALAAAPVSSAPAVTATSGSPGFVPDSGAPTATAGRTPPPASVPPCADGDLALTVAATPSPGLLGATFTFTVTIANVSADWCARDLGPGAQELRVMRDGVLVFSSDDCGTDHTSDVRAFATGDGVRYRFEWSSYRATPHTCTLAAQPAPVGTYQLIGRLGSKLSAPADFDIVR